MIEQNFLRHRVISKLDFGAAIGPHRAEEQQSDRSVLPDFPPLNVLQGPSSPLCIGHEPMLAPALDQPKVNPGVGGSAWV